VRSDLLELLPRDSPGVRAFEHQLGRVGGGSTLIVIVESPDRRENERFIDTLASSLDTMKRADCAAGSSCPGKLITYIEANTRDVRAYYETNKWLYADLADLKAADDDLDHAIAQRSGMVDDLETPSQEPSAPAAASAKTTAPKKRALGLGAHLDKWNADASKQDAFPSGYFANDDGTLLGLRIVSNTTLGHRDGDVLLAKVQQTIAAQRAAGHYAPGLAVGLTGDIASAADEKKALVSDAAWATLGALVVILLALVLYYRSVWSLVVIALPALFGISAAYAFATVEFGYVNTCGVFLGAIILGNGINYPIVLLSRYREFVSRGMPPAEALRTSVLNALRAELVGACVASIAYGSLIATRFRGFNQFGAIGFVGMLAVWASIVPLVPALVVIGERLERRLPARLRWHRNAATESVGLGAEVMTRLSALPTRHAWPIVIAGVLLVTASLALTPSYLRDPWEYDLGKLGSKSSDQTGAGEWSNKANTVFGGKMNIAGALMLADTPEQVPELKKKILENDARDPAGSMIAEVTALDDVLPGTRDLQEQKLAVLAQIRERLTPRVMSELDDDERATVEKSRPPETLRVLGPRDLPPLLLRRFIEADGRVGTIFYVKPRNEVVFADGHNHLRFSRTTDNLELASGARVMTASRSTIFAEMLRSIRRDGPIASAVASCAVITVVIAASRGMRSVIAVLGALMLGVATLVGWAAIFDMRINYVNFIALPITLGIGCEYPFNIADRARLLDGDAVAAVRRSAGAVMMCSFTTVVGYGSLVFSDFQALEGFGKLAVVGEIGCVFGAVLFVPALLTLLSRGRAMTRARRRPLRSARRDRRHRCGLGTSP
jgi:predicted RND superfamily exporter protein